MGSSRKRSSGLPMMPRPTSRRRCWPPDRRLTRSSAFSASPMSSITSSTGRGFGVVAGVAGQHLAHRVVRLDGELLEHHADAGCAASAGCCGRPDRRRACSTRPALRVRKPSRISTVVVLPAPLGPSSANTSPFCTSKLTSRTATVSPYDLARCSTVTAGMGARLSGVLHEGWFSLGSFSKVISSGSRRLAVGGGGGRRCWSAQDPQAGWFFKNDARSRLGLSTDWVIVSGITSSP